MPQNDTFAFERVFVVGHELGGRLGFHLSARPDGAAAR
jgi:hypothetical protein